MFIELGVPTTFLLTSFYWDNMIYFGMNPKPGPDGVLAITMPMGDTKLGAEDLGNMVQFYRDFPGPFLGVRKLDASRAPNPGLQDFATWLARNKHRIPLA